MKIEWDFSELYKFADKLGDYSRYERELKRATKEIAHELLKRIKTHTPIGDTWELINGWNDNAFLVRSVEGGFEVEIVNKTEYALWVNDGHKAYNQYGGPYKIHNRVKVTSQYQWQKGNPDYYVFGHFFVERGILEFANSSEIEDIIMKHLHRWWEGCF